MSIFIFTHLFNQLSPVNATCKHMGIEEVTSGHIPKEKTTLPPQTVINCQ